MNCECGGDTDVYNSRPAPNNTIRRNRACKVCGARFATIEAREDRGRDGKIAAAIEAAKISSATLDIFIKAMTS